MYVLSLSLPDPTAAEFLVQARRNESAQHGSAQVNSDGAQQEEEGVEEDEDEEMLPAQR